MSCSRTIAFRLMTCGSVAIACLCLCAKAPTMAGATSETTNGQLQGKVMRPDAKPAAGAAVRLVDDEKWLANLINGRPMAIDSAIADDSGRFTIYVPLHHGCNIQIDNGNQGLLVRDIASSIDSGVNRREFTLMPFAALSGSIVTESGTPDQLAFSGSLYRTPVNANSFSINALAEGTFDLVAGVNSSTRTWSLCTAVRLSAGAAIAAGGISASLSNLLVDDFSGGGWQTNLGRLIGGGYWYTVTDSAGGGSSSIAMSDDSSSAAYSGASRHVSYVIGATSAHPYGIMGFYIGVKDSAYVPATASLGALSFMMRGKGIITVSFVNILTDAAEKKRSVSFDYTVTVPSSWSRMEIPVDSLRVTSDNQSALLGKSWGQFNHSIQIITFMASGLQTATGDTVDVWLDDIALKGVSLRDFIP
jgi:hypothetical protein